MPNIRHDRAKTSSEAEKSILYIFFFVFIIFLGENRFFYLKIAIFTHNRSKTTSEGQKIDFFWSKIFFIKIDFFGQKSIFWVKIRSKNFLVKKHFFGQKSRFSPRMGQKPHLKVKNRFFIANYFFSQKSISDPKIAISAKINQKSHMWRRSRPWGGF